MPKLAGVDDLTRVREEFQQAMQAQHDSQIVIFVGTGTCGLAAGAGDTLQQIHLELNKRGIAANVTTVGCIGMCVKEPLVDVQLPGQPRVTYANVKTERVPRIVEQHVVGGQPVTEWVIGTVPGDW
jgi:NADP-reducing hydrogenase subunit HndB